VLFRSDALFVGDCGEKKANGLWFQIAIQCGRPQYQMPSWEGTISWNRDSKQWRMDKVDDGCTRILYVSAEDTDVVPDAGWVAVNGKEGPPSIIPDQSASMVAHWIELMQRAPDAGDELLEILTTAPIEESAFHHALPTQAVISDMNCDYKMEKTWKCNTETLGEEKQNHRRWPQWHEQLAPPHKIKVAKRRLSHSRDVATKGTSYTFKDMARKLGVKTNVTPVHIRMLQMPGVISVEVLQALAETEHLGIFRSQAAQAILKYTWESFVRRYHTVQLIHRFIELFLLVSLIWLAPWVAHGTGWTDTFWYHFYLHCVSSFLAVSAAKDTFQEFNQCRGFFVILFTPEAYLLNGFNYLDISNIALFNVYACHMLFRSWTGRSLTRRCFFESRQQWCSRAGSS